ncbi:hypothetical protein NPIL_65091 [Nephila pilipes]|uniref:Ras-GEF domain-containing protein n=1 Tax=Nephila pilipes TaxID=299642 RepID=A0A8X6TSE0_NEPPI|nr:hypothetical protein NPIL_65091 [Nephila pilipes]
MAAQKAWYWFKTKLVPVPHVKVPTAAVFTDVQAKVYAEQLTLADAAAFKTIDISELKNHPFEAELSTNLEHFTARFNYLSDWTVRTILAQSCSKRRATFFVTFHRHRRGPPSLEKRSFSVFNNLCPHKRSNREIENFLVSCPQEQKAHLPNSVRASVLGGEF